ncbi:MAG: CBS domain-containing protein [Gemmatimonadales bacterium]
MLRLREIMSTDIVSVGPETTIREAMELFAHRHISGAPVVTGSTLVGVVTSTDLMAFAASLPGVPTERDTRDHLDDEDEAPVDDESGQVAEMGSDFLSEMWDDAGAEVTERMAQRASPEWNVLEEHAVSEAMTRSPLCTLGPDDSAESAAALMEAREIHRILVTENGALVGTVSTLDIAKAAAHHRFTVRQYVFNSASRWDRQ